MRYTMRAGIFAAAAMTSMAATAQAAELSVTMHAISEQGVGDSIGTVTIADSPQGATFTTDLAGLPPGERGFHLHAVGDCGAAPNDAGVMTAGQAAKGHWDPESTGRHEGPEGEGHLGDLPALTVAADGSAKVSLVAPRIKDVSQLRGRALMIHAGGDNYSDQPKPLGGGGGRIACGVIE